MSEPSAPNGPGTPDETGPNPVVDPSAVIDQPDLLDAPLAAAPDEAEDEDQDGETDDEKTSPEVSHGGDGEPESAAGDPPDLLDAPEAAADAAASPDDEPVVAGPNPKEVARVRSVLESLLFVADGPVAYARLASILDDHDAALVKPALEALAGEWSTRGVQLVEVAGGYQLRSNPANSDFVQRFLAQKPVRLSRAQLETLAIVAYRQPVTRPEIDDIRGVDSGAVLKVLLDRSLLRILGKKEEPGRPMLYGTTKEFLEFFNLRDLRDLPTLREFHELTEEHQAQVNALEDLAGADAVEGDAGAAPVAESAGDTAPVARAGSGTPDGTGAPDSPDSPDSHSAHDSRTSPDSSDEDGAADDDGSPDDEDDDEDAE
jgi:segregation and condensation protein B